MSLRAELVRLGLRWFVKRKIGPAVTLEALRRQDAFLERLVPPPPKGTQATHVDLDGVKAVAVVTPASHGGRLVLYLHGGGHVSGSPALYGDFTWRIAAATRARTVILDHRLAPEHPFPAALDDAVTASMIPCAWRSGCAPPDVRSNSKYGRGCRTPGRSGRGS